MAVISSPQPSLTIRVPVPTEVVKNPQQQQSNVVQKPPEEQSDYNLFKQSGEPSHSLILPYYPSLPSAVPQQYELLDDLLIQYKRRKLRHKLKHYIISNPGFLTFPPA